jgi:Domain of unknown function (DUF6089)
MFKILPIAFFTLFAAQICAQNNSSSDGSAKKITEIGISVNMFHYSGDLAEERIVLKEGEYGFGFHIRHQLTDRVHLFANGIFGRIAGDDANNGPGLRERKYRFFSPIREFSAQVEFYPTKTFVLGSANSFTLRPYMFAGAGIVKVDPKAEYYGPGISPFPEPDLKKTLITTPVGFGFRSDVYERISIHGSIGWRPVYSDELDGVSINANPNNPDWYTNFQLGFSYTIRGYDSMGF